MKFYQFSMLACLMLCALPSVAFADVIMPNTHAIEKCVKISGLDAYPNYTLIGVVSPVMGGPLELVKITNSQCIAAGSHYKFDRFSIYYTNTSYYEKVGMSGIKTGNSTNGRQEVTDDALLLIGVEQASAPYAPYYVSDTDSSKSITMEYNVYSCRGGLCLQKLKETKSDLPLNATADGLPPSPPGEPVNPPRPENAPSALEAFWCWLTSLFGQNCAAYAR